MTTLSLNKSSIQVLAETVNQSFANQTATGVPGQSVVIGQSFDVLLDIQRHPVQRDEGLRLPKMTKIFKSGNPTLFNFAIIEVTVGFNLSIGQGEYVWVEPGFYMCDGHTRRLFFKLNPEYAPKHPVLITVYRTNDPQTFIDLYNGYDSSDSVETAGNKLQGAFGLLGMRDLVNAPVLRRGGIKTAIELAYPGDSKDNLIGKVSYFKDEIILLDNLGKDNATLWHSKDNGLRFQTFWAACLITAKMFNGDRGSHSYQRMEYMMRTFARMVEDDFSSSNQQWDGITALLWTIYNYDRSMSKRQWIPEGMLRKTSYSTVAPQMNFFLYCMIEMYMGDKLIDRDSFKSKSWSDMKSEYSEERIGYYKHTLMALADQYPTE